MKDVVNMHLLMEKLECLKYLYENGCPWNKNSCERASFNGHIEVLKYLLEKGCPWDKWYLWAHKLDTK